MFSKVLHKDELDTKSKEQGVQLMQKLQLL